MRSDGVSGALPGRIRPKLQLTRLLATFIRTSARLGAPGHGRERRRAYFAVARAFRRASVLAGLAIPPVSSVFGGGVS
jgi:hypothetical protein